MARISDGRLDHLEERSRELRTARAEIERLATELGHAKAFGKATDASLNLCRKDYESLTTEVRDLQGDRKVLSESLLEALKHNWLDDDYPGDLLDQFRAIATPHASTVSGREGS